MVAGTPPTTPDARGDHHWSFSTASSLHRLATPDRFCADGARFRAPSPFRRASHFRAPLRDVPPFSGPFPYIRQQAGFCPSTGKQRFAYKSIIARHRTMNMLVNGSAFNGHTGLDGEQSNTRTPGVTTPQGPRRPPSGGAILENLSVFAKRRPDGARLRASDLLTKNQGELLDSAQVSEAAVDAADEAALQEAIAASLTEARPKAAPSLPRRPTGDAQTPAGGTLRPSVYAGARRPQSAAERQASLDNLRNVGIGVKPEAIAKANEEALQEAGRQSAAATGNTSPRPGTSSPRTQPIGPRMAPTGPRPPVPPARRASTGGDKPPPVPPRPTTLPRQNSAPQLTAFYGHGSSPQAARDDSRPLPNPWGGKPQSQRPSAKWDSGSLPNPWDTKPQSQRPSAKWDSGSLPNPWDTKPQQARPQQQGASAESPRPAAPQARPSPSASASHQASPGPQKTPEAAKPQAASVPLAIKDPKELLSGDERWNTLTELSQAAKEETTRYGEPKMEFTNWGRKSAGKTSAEREASARTMIQEIDKSLARLGLIASQIKGLDVRRWALKWHPDKPTGNAEVMKAINGKVQAVNESLEKKVTDLQSLKGLLESVQ
jgi:hypothetical protein